MDNFKEQNEFKLVRILDKYFPEYLLEYLCRCADEITQAGYVQLQAGEDGLVTEKEIVKYASQDSTYCQLSVDVGLWASKAQKALDDKEKEGAVREV